MHRVRKHRTNVDFVFLTAYDRQLICAYKICRRDWRRIDRATDLAQYGIGGQNYDGPGNSGPEISGPGQHAYGRCTPQGCGSVDSLYRTLVTHDYAAAQEAHARHNISGDPRG